MHSSFPIFLILLFSVGIHSIALSMVPPENHNPAQKNESTDLTHEERLKQLNDEERAWYEKFHHGTIFFSGWKEISEEIVSALPPEKHSPAKKKLKRLGVRIGTEWSKDNSIRKINTGMLRSWGNELKKARKQGSRKILDKVREISAEVDRILAENTSGNGQENKSI